MLQTAFDIIGIGLISPMGNSLVDFWGAINKGTKLWDQSRLALSNEKLFYCAKVEAFDPLYYFNEKQLHNLDRNSIFVAAAAKEALRDAAVNVVEVGSHKVGVSIGTSVSIATSMSDFDESVLKFGGRRSSIGIFPNTVMCAPASRISIFEKITGCNTTISSGMNSGLDAIGHACFCVESNIAEVMIGGGADALSDKILLGYDHENLLIDKIDRVKPNKRGCFIPSEGASVLVLKKKSQHNSHRYGQLQAYQSAFCPEKRRMLNVHSETIARTAKKTLSMASVSPNEVDAVIISGYFDKFVYDAEILATRNIFPEDNKRPYIFSPKMKLGESFSAFSGLMIIFGIGLINRSIAESEMQKMEVSNKKVNVNLFKKILILQSDSAGHYSSIILRNE